NCGQHFGPITLDDGDDPVTLDSLPEDQVAHRTDDQGLEANRLVRWVCIGCEPGDAFAPADGEGEQAGADQDAVVEPPPTKEAPTGNNTPAETKRKARRGATGGDDAP